MKIGIMSIVFSLIFGACTPSSHSERYSDFPLEKRTEYLRKTKVASYVSPGSLEKLQGFSHATFYGYFNNPSDALKTYNAVQTSLKQNAPRVFFECELFLSLEEEDPAEYGFSVFCDSLSVSCASKEAFMFERYFLKSVSVLNSGGNFPRVECRDL